MRQKTVTVTLLQDDAAKIITEHAAIAARFGAYLDYVDRRTANAPVNWHRDPPETLEHARERWHRVFVRSKRIVEAFGATVEALTREETVVQHEGYRSRPGNKKRVPYSYPCMRQVQPACDAAAKRCVDKWLAIQNAPDLPPGFAEALGKIPGVDA